MTSGKNYGTINEKSKGGKMTQKELINKLAKEIEVSAKGLQNTTEEDKIICYVSNIGYKISVIKRELDVEKQTEVK